MPRRLSKRLAGCIVIEFLLAGGAVASAAEYRTGFGRASLVQAVALEDRRFQRAVIVSAAFDIPLAVADHIAAQAIQRFGLDRAALLLHSTGAGSPAPDDALNAIGAAVSDLHPGTARFNGQGLTVRSEDDACVTVLAADASFRECTTHDGALLRGPIRSALKIVDLNHGLQTRTGPPRSFAVQAIALGASVVLLAAPSNFLQASPGRILAGSPAVEGGSEVTAAIQEVLARVGRKR